MKKLILITITALFTVNIWGQSLWQIGSDGKIYYNNGNVGIGTTTPTAKLEIIANGRNTLKITNPDDAAKYLNIWQGSSGVVFDPIGTTKLYLGYEESTDVIISRVGGKVGIGTSNPTANLHILAPSNPQFQLRSTGTGGRLFSVTVNDDDELLNISSSYGSLGAYPMVFRMGHEEMMRISRNGNVGIGSTNPSEKLHVNGNVFISDGNSIYSHTYSGKGGYIIPFTPGGDTEIYNKWHKGNINFYTSGEVMGGSSLALQIKNNGNVGIGTDSPVSILHLKGSTSIFETFERENFAKKGHIGYGTANGGGVYLGTDDNQYSLWVQQNGYIGIGTTNPKYKLSVKGTIGCGEVIVENVTTWSDFVFEPDYNLMTLKDLETFIKTNKHLPEIPTTAEVEKNGISVGEMNAKLLQKIEELTLYVIEIQKEVEKLKEQNKE